jgi:hypothetical protein
MPPDTVPARSDLLLYVGSGLAVGSVAVGAAVGLAYVLRKEIREFKYGVFYSVFALVAAMGYCLASIAFFFQFLARTPDLPVFCSLVSLGIFAGLIVMTIYIRKDSLVLFAIMSFYSLATVWLAPIFLWNLIYLCLVITNRQKAPATPPPL